MGSISSQERQFLAQLNTMSGGDPDAQVSMYELGEAMGLDRTEAGQMAESLFIGGYAELKTLSGGIGITAMGLEELGLRAPGGAGRDESLGTDPVLAGSALEAVSRVVADLKEKIPGGGLSYERLDEVMTDMKTLEVHLLSPRPKTAVAREVFRSLAQAVDTPALGEMKSRLTRLVSGS